MFTRVDTLVERKNPKHISKMSQKKTLGQPLGTVWVRFGITLEFFGTCFRINAVGKVPKKLRVLGCLWDMFGKSYGAVCYFLGFRKY
jgi:hypothetical protein